MNTALLTKYPVSGPRYTSYPTALEFGELDPASLIQGWTSSDKQALSLYLHIPFCHSLCYYCGCNKQVTRQRQKSETYLQYLLLEIKQRAALFSGKPVTQIHFGGGTPTYLDDDQLSRLMAALRLAFEVAAKAEISIEIDPRQTELPRLGHLAALGFNRLSIGVQDFDSKVQQAVNRVQDEEHIFQLVKQGRALGFSSISLDLIYGLPHQSVESFRPTMEKVLALRPDRLSLFNYAHLPEKFAAQRRIKESDLPTVNERRAIFTMAATLLVDGGYLCIGMDHFALADDELAKAQREGKLHRNFQGYTTQQEADLLGLGVSAISQIGHVLAQNHKEIKDYYGAVEAGGSATDKGYALDQDDKIRGVVIKELICHFHLHFGQIEKRFGLEFNAYFADDLRRLAEMEKDGLVRIDKDSIEVTDAGRPWIRAICMQFDRYMTAKLNRSFSRII
ncbi:oxygen-independent coproporphyrinogen III oxidase [Aliiglaciecola sp. CAU 1673]|uniref:oxygen-independent coproporphyrinogen III oxidase n=1 Tax=Aliiglaciecola sp. CAU 1673 TaxID=3032595 RepID=UPI0023DAA5D7|nr:oxygen-independent coproporphyrinogen III oxidase [Aliiglaciecola sp. CAU 1673]MDF2179687.1 oxygen-independent coproporphyrinogen III oxidase [Aliiglaciecola sp. CAU 1673]